MVTKAPLANNSTSASDSSREFLELFPQNQRSLTANMFCSAVRLGARTVDAVLAAVRADVESRLRSARRYGDGARIRQFSAFRDYLDTESASARAYARWTLGWESLSIAQKDEIKTQRGAEHRQRWMQSQPPTDRQIAYLRALGWTADVSSKAKASELIDRLRSRRGGA